MRIKKIIFCEDFASAPFTPGVIRPQLQFAHFAHDLLKPVFRSIAPGIKTLAAWDLNRDGTDYLARDFFNASYAAISESAWFRAYERTPSPRQLALLADSFADSLVIAHDLAPSLAGAFTRLGVPYLDFIPHPAKYLKKLPLCVRSNVSGMAECFRPWHLAGEKIAFESGLAVTLLARLGPLPYLKGSRSAALFICQEARDKTLASNGRFARTEDFAERISALINRFDIVLVKAPAENASRTELFLTRICPKTRLVAENPYHLLAQDKITDVYSLSSAWSMIAPWFCKRGECLAGDPFRISDAEITEEDYFPIQGALWQPALWSRVFDLLGIEHKPVKRDGDFDAPIQNPYAGAEEKLLSA